MNRYSVGKRDDSENVISVFFNFAPKSNSRIILHLYTKRVFDNLDAPYLSSNNCASAKLRFQSKL